MQLPQEERTDVFAEILDYKEKLLKDPKKKNAFEKSKAHAEEKALSLELSVADWRKIFKFSYADGDIVIKELRSFDEVITVPAKIGSKKVRMIDRNAFFFGRQRDGQEPQSPKKIIISEGIEEICRGAFSCINNTEIFIPDTVTALPEDVFTVIRNLEIHLPATMTEISDKICGGSLKSQIKKIHAPAGSYAEKYALKHNIPFVAE